MTIQSDIVVVVVIVHASGIFIVVYILWIVKIALYVAFDSDLKQYDIIVKITKCVTDRKKCDVVRDKYTSYTYYNILYRC